ncbi:MAG: polyribonucleotide nucleotidyltransferase, partial [Bacilli bacterium]|nr:polyribonucleotide nucleotidyltransferase [Bacilli bacterium]
KFEEEIIAAIGEEKMEYEKLEISDELRKEVVDFCHDKMDAALRIKDKIEKYEAIDKIKADLEEKYKSLYEDTMKLDEYKELITKVLLVFHDVEYEIFRNITVLEHTRADGRRMDEIRPLDTQIDLLPRTHGSALFTRGQTQSLATVTLGALGEHQILDGLGIEDEKRFMLHYNFPAFSVGETGRYGSPGRREIGHGALGERALSYVIPDEEKFPYTIRVVSEILESNGSSSQATICAGCMALMAAGVPIKTPVAGIAMGLITSGSEYTVLTDIQGLEDHLGDMDFKVAGSREGITALQMDIKIDGINKQILKEALAQAKKARMEILDKIESTIAEPRKEVSKYAPKTCIFMINPDKIKDVIGRGGEMITKIIQECSNVVSVNDDRAVKVDLEDDGRVTIYHMDQEVIDKTRERIENIVREVEIGKVYNCKVVDIQDFGAFVEVWPGCEGLIHISQLDTSRVNKVTDILQVGDEVLAIATGYDKKGKLNLSRKELLLKNKPKKEEKEEVVKDEEVSE